MKLTLIPWNQELFKISKAISVNKSRIPLDTISEYTMFVKEKIYYKLIEQTGKRTPINSSRSSDTYLEFVRKDMLKRLKLDRPKASIWSNPFSIDLLFEESAEALYLYNRYKGSKNKEEKQQALDILVNCRIFDFALSLLRKGYLTVCTGDQFEDVALHLTVAEFIIEDIRQNDYPKDNYFYFPL